MLQRAIDSFSKQIDLLTDKEIEERLGKYNSDIYAGLTLHNICSWSPNCGFKLYHTKVQNFGWFSINSSYFNKISDFYINNFFDEGGEKRSVSWKQKPINVSETDFEENLNPQTKLWVFCLCLYYESKYST